MKNYYWLAIILSFLFLESCSSSRRTSSAGAKTGSTAIRSTVVIRNKVPERVIRTKGVAADDVVSFAETLIAVPYKYGSMVKANGFDCSGFINYVFNHFNISVPRSSVDFTNSGKEVLIEDSRRGDIILFTGSNANSGIVGHMGIITHNKKGQVEFIHASSGKPGGVMLSGMNSYFIPRFVKVIRIFTFD